MIELDKFKKDYPKSYKLLLELYNDPKLVGLLGDKEREQALDMALIYSPRFLFDWFDQKGIFIGIKKWKDSWIYTLDGNDWNGSADTRGEAELEAFLEAFKIIEAR